MREHNIGDSAQCYLNVLNGHGNRVFLVGIWIDPDIFKSCLKGCQAISFQNSNDGSRTIVWTVDCVLPPNFPDSSKDIHPLLRRSFFKYPHAFLVVRGTSCSTCTDLEVKGNELGLVLIIHW